MIQQNNIARCDRTELTGNWDVQCLRCYDSIGSFSSEGLRRAIHNTRFRGGLLCPDCRAASCSICGQEYVEKEGDGEKAGKDAAEILCWFCSMEKKEKEESAVLSPCLVPHNSKTNPPVFALWPDNSGLVVQPRVQHKRGCDE